MGLREDIVEISKSSQQPENFLDHTNEAHGAVEIVLDLDKDIEEVKKALEEENEIPEGLFEMSLENLFNKTVGVIYAKNKDYNPYNIFDGLKNPYSKVCAILSERYGNKNSEIKKSQMRKVNQRLKMSVSTYYIPIGSPNASKQIEYFNIFEFPRLKKELKKYVKEQNIK